MLWMTDLLVVDLQGDRGEVRTTFLGEKSRSADPRFSSSSERRLLRPLFYTAAAMWNKQRAITWGTHSSKTSHGVTLVPWCGLLHYYIIDIKQAKLGSERKQMSE